MTGQVPIYYAHNSTGRPANPKEMLIDEIPVEAGQTSVGCRSFYLDAGASPLVSVRLRCLTLPLNIAI